jgi:tripartite-type tricarboxylate transporter receptor subunit TctC
MQEAGVPGYEVTAWFGIMLPKGAPKEVISRINGEVNKALLQADMKEKLLQQGALATAWTPQEFGSFIHDEVVKWGKVVKASGAKVE